MIYQEGGNLRKSLLYLGKLLSLLFLFHLRNVALSLADLPPHEIPFLAA